MIEKDATCDIRKLTPTDADRYRGFRLYALRRFPFAFSSHVEDESAKPLSWYAGRITAKESPDNFILGAFHQTSGLIGTVGLLRFERSSERHKATLFGMAVHENHSGRGIGKALVTTFVAEARNIQGLLQIILSVSEGNSAAQKLYRSCGFKPYGLEPRAIIKDGTAINKIHMVLQLD